MDQRAWLALIAPPHLSRREAEALVRRELRRRGEEPWPDMEIELFSGEKGGLLIARRRDERHIYISAAALGVLINHCE